MDNRTPRDWGGTYETLELARLIARPGWTPEQAARTIRHLAQAGVIFPYGRPLTWPLSSGAATLALKALFDAGISDRTVIRHASVGLWGWQPGQSEKSKTAGHPILAALTGTASGEWWVFQTRALRHDQTGQTQFWGYVYSDNNPPEFSRDPRDPWQVETSITVNLRPLLLPLVAKPRGDA